MQDMIFENILISEILLNVEVFVLHILWIALVLKNNVSRTVNRRGTLFTAVSQQWNRDRVLDFMQKIGTYIREISVLHKSQYRANINLTPKLHEKKFGSAATLLWNCDLCIGL